MKTIRIELTKQEVLALQGVGISPQDWTEDAVKKRVDLAMEDIVKIFVDRANREDVQIPIGRDAIVEEALERGWV